MTHFEFEIFEIIETLKTFSNFFEIFQIEKTDLENPVRTVTYVADLAEHLVAVVLLALLPKALEAQLLLVLFQVELLRAFPAIVVRALAVHRFLVVDLVLVDGGQLVHQLLAALRTVLQERAVVVDAAVRLPFPLHRPYHVDYGVHHLESVRRRVLQF